MALHAHTLDRGAEHSGILEWSGACLCFSCDLYSDRVVQSLTPFSLSLFVLVCIPPTGQLGRVWHLLGQLRTNSMARHMAASHKRELSMLPYAARRRMFQLATREARDCLDVSCHYSKAPKQQALPAKKTTYQAVRWLRFFQIPSQTSRTWWEALTFIL